MYIFNTQHNIPSNNEDAPIINYKSVTTLYKGSTLYHNTDYRYMYIHTVYMYFTDHWLHDSSRCGPHSSCAQSNRLAVRIV